MDEHLAPVVQRGALRRARDRGRDLVTEPEPEPEPEPIRERTQAVESDVGDDAAASGSDNDGALAESFHLKDAFRYRWTVA